MESLESRQNELEMRFMHQQQFIEELNEVLLLFGRRLDVLERELGRLRETVGGMETTPELSPDE